MLGTIGTTDLVLSTGGIKNKNYGCWKKNKRKDLLKNFLTLDLIAVISDIL